MRWNSHPTPGILTIAYGSVTYLDQFDNYGHIGASDLTVHETTYVNADTRQTKHYDQLYHCLKNSLTASGTAKIISESTKYHIGSNTCGALLFKLLIHNAIIDTRSTASNIRENLSSIDTYTATVKSEIDKFNEYAKINYEGLTARGDRCNYMVSNVFKGYVEAQDKEFVRYVQHQNDKYENSDNIHKDKLITLTLNKYENLCTKEKWLDNLPKEEHIVALSS